MKSPAAVIAALLATGIVALAAAHLPVHYDVGEVNLATEERIQLAE